MKAYQFKTGILVLFISALPTQGFIIGKVYVEGVEFEHTTSSEARSDLTADGTTVGVSLNPNFSKKRWELRMFEYATLSKDLKLGLDVTLGKELTVELITYPLGDAQYGRGYYINGQDLSEFDYNPTLDTLKLKFKPTAPAISDSYSGGWTATAGMDIYFRGTDQNPLEINYGPPVIMGNFLPEDVDRAMHPSSDPFIGKVRSFAGVNGEQGSFEYYLGSRHATHKGYDLYNSEAYVDGTQPSANFGWSISTPSINFDLGHTEDFRVYAVYNTSWSVRDIQVGQFPITPAFTHISADPGGIQMFWNADTNKSYTLEYFTALGGSTHVLATNLTTLGFLDNSPTQSNRFYRLLQE